MKKIYILKVSGKRIGHTEFEHADPPMGIVYGEIIFDNIEFPYKFLKEYCVKNNVKINTDYPNDYLISTGIIPQLKVYLPNGKELNGWGAAITGMDSDKYAIQFEGINSELMQLEFEHHYNGYWRA